MSRIIELKSTNVKKIKAVEIRPDGNIVSIGGKNGAGKSSVLDSIYYAFAGKDSLPKVPVRRGEDKAGVVVELEDMIVKRTFTSEGGTSLVVTNKDGLKYPSPQSLLDAMVGKLSFDPFEFARQRPEIQAATLRQLVGLDLSALNTERKGYYDSRTLVGREVTALEGQASALPAPQAGLPDAEVSAADIIKEQQAAMAVNAGNAKTRAGVSAIGQTVQISKNECGRLADELEGLELELTELNRRIQTKKQQIEVSKSRLTANQAAYDSAKAEADKLVDADLSGFAVRLQEIETTNRAVRANASRKDVDTKLKTKCGEYDALSAKIDQVDAQKTKLLEETKFPIDGLSVADDGGVMFNGLPFEQAASAEQLRVSVSIGLALNPKLRVLLIRDGSLLDEDSLTLLQTMADEAQAQIWIERVGTDGEVSVIIEDGMVRATPPEESTANKPKAQKEGELL